MQDDELRKKIEKKYFTKSSFIETQIWIYSSFSAISLGFFFSLLGANDTTTKDFFTDISIYTFSISLILNAFIALIFSIFRDDGDLIYKFNLSSTMNYIILSAWGSFIFSILFIIFSIKAMISSIVIGVFMFFMFKKIKEEIMMNEKKEHELEMEKIRKDEID
jgi:hypothetical protein